MSDFVLFWPCAEYEECGKTEKLWTYNGVENLGLASDVFAAWEDSGYKLKKAWVEVRYKDNMKIIKFRKEWIVDEEETK